MLKYIFIREVRWPRGFRLNCVPEESDQLKPNHSGDRVYKWSLNCCRSVLPKVGHLSVTVEREGVRWLKVNVEVKK